MCLFRAHWKCTQTALELHWDPSGSPFDPNQRPLPICCHQFVIGDWSCSETALKMLWKCSETALELLWNCSGTALKLPGSLKRFPSIDLLPSIQLDWISIESNQTHRRREGEGGRGGGGRTGWKMRYWNLHWKCSAEIENLITLADNSISQLRIPAKPAPLEFELNKIPPQ